jgi:hypothetical protein
LKFSAEGIRNVSKPRSMSRNTLLTWPELVPSGLATIVTAPVATFSSIVNVPGIGKYPYLGSDWIRRPLEIISSGPRRAQPASV